MRAKLSRLVYERLIARNREYRVYEADSGQWRVSSPSPIQMFDADNPPPGVILDLYKSHFGRFRSLPMLNRLYRHGAVLLALVEFGELHGVGWLQRGRQLNREFWWLDSGAVCLGPFWTHPDHRGKGVYGRLIDAAMTECARRGWERTYIFAQASNVPSIRGIEKAGFSSMGTHRIGSYFMGLIRRHQSLG